MDSLMNLVNIILAAVGMSHVQALAVGFNAVMGAVSVPITNWLKPQLAKLPFLASEKVQSKIQGWLTILVSGVIGIIFMLLGDKLFGLQLLTDQGAFATVVAAFGVNQTFASIFFEWNKSKKKQ